MIKSTKDNSLRFLKQKELGLPYYTVLEEVFNSITHGIGALFGILSIVILIYLSPKDFLSVFCVSVYGGTIFLLYFISTMYHALKICKAKKIFRILDHCSIFLLIAGTYTPICFFKMGKIGVIMLFVVWAVTALGIILNSINIKKYTKFSMVCYLVMGWAVIFTIKPLLENITLYQFSLLMSGGLVYTIGAVLYYLGKKVRYIHSLWHIFVLCGSVLQFFMIYNFLISI